MVRAPLFPVEAYHELSAQAAERPSAMLSAEHPLAQLAIGVSSPTLLEEIERPTLSQRERRRRDYTLLRYLIRMSTRPTPYGLFAGVALGRLGETTNLSIANPQASLVARLDMGWLLSCIWKLEALPEVRRHLRWVTNSAVFLHNGRVWLHERASAETSQAIHAVSLRATAAVTHTLRLARQPVDYPDLVAGLLAAIPGATLAQAEGLLSELWHQTVLLSDLRPPLTGALHPAYYLQRRLAAIPATAPLAEQLAALLEELLDWEADPGAMTVPRYRAVLERMEQFMGAADTVAERYNVLPSSRSSEAPGAGKPMRQAQAQAQPLLQLDLGLGLAGQTIAASIGADVARMAEIVLRLSPAPRGPASLSAYRQAFIERYGEDRAVPLVELLDPHVGLGLLENSRNTTTPEQESRQTAKRNQALMTLALTAQQKRQVAVELNETALNRLETWRPDPATAPASVDLTILLAATSAQAVDAGQYQLVLGPNVGGQTGGRIFGRFATLMGREGIEVLRQIAVHEERQTSGCLRAEVIFLPKRNRLSNLTIHPSITPYEIVYGTAPGVAPAQTIPLHELMVGLRQGRFYLRWPRENMDIIAQVGHMLQPHAAPPIARFLSSISEDGTPLLSSFDWGTAQDFPFLPRLQMGRLVFALAQWRLTADLREHDLPTTVPETFHVALHAWRTLWQVPRFVYLSFADHRLLLDLEQPQQREQLRAELHKLPDNTALLLQEVFPTLDQAWVQGPEGHHVTELIFPLLRRETPQTDTGQATTPEETVLERSNASLAAPPMPTPAQRLKALGSEWLFVKLYVSRDLQEELLSGPLRVFASNMLAAGFAEDWFFLRFSDPDPHLRLRFRGEQKVLMSKLLPALCDLCTRLITQGPCLKYCLDTYDREIERYGGLEGMELAESLFGADSRAVVDVLAALAPAGKLALERQVLATLTVDDLLMSLGADKTARLAWARWRVQERHQAGQAYRQHGKQLRLLLSDPAQALADVPAGMAVLSILAERRRVLAPIAERLRELAAERRLCQPLTSLYASYVHLHCNRLLGVDRAAEDEVLGLVLRTYVGLERAPLAAHH
jgi:thiopeptide-type bacteriocin biosynthesis protein